MTGLENSLDDLLKTHTKYNLSGSFRKNNLVSWPHELPSSIELEYLYTNFSPLDIKIDTGFSPLKIISIHDLQTSQIGYRWVFKNNILERNDSWPAEYIVIADDFGGGKPIIAATNESGTPIYARYSSGNPFKIANNITDFLKALTMLIEIIYGHFNIFEMTDDNDDILPEFIQMIEKKITPIVGNENFDSFYEYFYG